MKTKTYLSDTPDRTPRSDSEAIIEAALAAAEPVKVSAGDLLSVIVPVGTMHQIVDLERQLEAPRRTRGKVTFRAPESFAEYVNDHKYPGATRIYALWSDTTAVAVINDDHRETAGWRDHRAVLEFVPTPEWNHWTRGATMHSQQDFAEHIEEGLDQIIEPPAADMLELAQRFEAAQRVTFKSANILANGQRQLLYDEQIEARAGETGQITIPREFSMALEPYEGSAPYKMVARLRYRIREGRLSIGYVLDRPDRVQREAFQDVLNKVEELTGITPLIGRAPDPTA